MDKNEFKQLFDKHFEEIRRYLFYRSGDEDLATDLAQDTFMRLWEKQFDLNMSTARALLYKIAGDLFVSRYRKEQSRYNFFNNYTPDSYDRSPEEQITYNEMLSAYEQALDSMNDKQRTVFLMSRVEELKYHEIADRLELSVKAVEKRMSLALGHMRTALKGYSEKLILFSIFLKEKFGTFMIQSQ